MTTRRHRRYLAEVRRIITRRVGRAHASVILFGSFARGDVHPGSDIDVAVRCRGAVSRAVFTAIRDDLEESRIPYRVDLVDLREASSRLRRRIHAEGIAWTA